MGFLPRAELWPLVLARSAQAHASGALYRIESEPQYVEEDGVEFVVRRAIDFERQVARMPRSRPGNPFLPPEPELFLGNVSATHYALLNKYHVIENHLLVVTREYVAQEVLLDLADFQALVECLPLDKPALAFYNGGRGSGASQPHKHLQVVTLPLSPHADIPMAARFARDEPSLPFRHGFARTATRDPAAMLDCYRTLLAQAGVDGPYNFLVAPEWMLMVPRSRDAYEGVAINSLAFAGALFVRRDHQLEAVHRVGPWGVLAHTALPRPGASIIE